MLAVNVEKDRYGRNQAHYSMIAGDFIRILSQPIQPDGDAFDTTNVLNVVFHILGLDKSIIFEKALEKVDNGYLLTLETKDTIDLNAGNYLYEIKYEVSEGNWITSNLYKWDIMEGGKGDCHYE